MVCHLRDVLTFSGNEIESKVMPIIEFLKCVIFNKNDRTRTYAEVSINDTRIQCLVDYHYIFLIL